MSLNPQLAFRSDARTLARKRRFDIESALTETCKIAGLGAANSFLGGFWLRKTGPTDAYSPGKRNQCVALRILCLTQLFSGSEVS